MGSPNDLTTLAAVKAYAQNTNSSAITLTQDDTVIGALITGCSQAALNTLARFTILRAQHTETFDGTGGEWMGQQRPFKFRPVLSVSSVYINSLLVPPISPTTAPNGSGWTYDVWDGVVPGAIQFLKLNGYGFIANWAPNNCTMNYTAGYGLTEEWTPATSITPAAPLGPLLRDDGVAYASSGTALTPVAATPAIGQYVPPNPLSLPATSKLPAGPTSNYLFNAGETQQLNISYSFVPSAIELAVRIWVGDQYKYMTRIGEKSASQGGVITAAYDIVDMPLVCKRLLGPFEDVNFVVR